MAWKGLRATLQRIAESNGGISPEFSLLNARDTRMLLEQRDELYQALKSALEQLPHTGGSDCAMCKLAGQIDQVLTRAGDTTEQSTEPPPYDVVFTCSPPGLPTAVLIAEPPMRGKCSICQKLGEVNAESWCFNCFSAASR